PGQRISSFFRSAGLSSYAGSAASVIERDTRFSRTSSTALPDAGTSEGAEDIAGFLRDAGLSASV
ncbi:unnamed protein product, partial [Amoebophrya sp. A25]